MTTGAKTRTRKDPEARRREILEVATRLISEHGYRGVSLEAIADGCHITKAGLQHHYPSKDDLLVAVLRQRDEADEEAARSYLEPPRSKNELLERFRLAFTRTVEQPEIIRLFTVLSAEALDEGHPAHAYFLERLAKTKTEFLRLNEAWYADPERAVVDYLSFLDGLQLNWLRDPSIDLQEHGMTFVRSQLIAG